MTCGIFLVSGGEGGSSDTTEYVTIHPLEVTPSIAAAAGPSLNLGGKDTKDIRHPNAFSNYRQIHLEKTFV